MRIVQLVENLEIGGLERLVVDLAAQQVSRGHNAYIFCLSQPGRFADQARKVGAKLIAFHKPSGPSAGAVLRMSKALRALRPHVVHTHSWVVHHYGVAAARLARVPVVVNTRHNILVSRRQERWYRPSLPFTDAVVMVSEDARASFARAGAIPSRLMTVIRNGIPTAAFEPRNTVERSPGRPIRFGTVGRLVPQKDHENLLRAFALLRTELPSATLDILGDGPLRSDLQAKVDELGLRESVRLLGPSLDVASFLESIDIFALSSKYEGLPIVILEAMAAGLPTVSTRVGGVPEVCLEGAHAFYVPPGDSSALSLAMLQAASSPELAAMGAAAKDHVRTFYDIASTWDQYERLFASLLARRGGAQ